MANTLLAVDGNSLVHRSFHAHAGTNLRTADGRPIWAVKGFFSQLLGAVDRTGADALVVGFDDISASSRKARWPHYKALRKQKPPELGQQIALTIDLLRAAGVRVVVPAGLEADDVLASAARTAADAGWRTVLVTSDRDSFALVDETTSVLRVINGGMDVAPLLNRKLLHTLVHVHAHQYREYAAMRGDTSDNLLGIRGIGEKTAVKLLEEFQTVRAAFDDADAGGTRVAAALGRSIVTKLVDPANREAFHRNVEIMTMHTDIELGLDLDGGGAGCLPLELDLLIGALRMFEMRSLESPALRVLTCPAEHDSVERAAAPPAYVNARPARVPVLAATWQQDTLF